MRERVRDAATHTDYAVTTVGGRSGVGRISLVFSTALGPGYVVSSVPFPSGTPYFTRTVLPGHTIDLSPRPEPRTSASTSAHRIALPYMYIAPRVTA